MVQQNVFPIPGMTEEELREICVRFGDNKAPGLDGIPNKTLKLAAKIRPTASGWSIEIAVWISQSVVHGRCHCNGRRPGPRGIDRW